MNTSQMIPRALSALLFAALLAATAVSQAQAPTSPTRGQLLYDTHCVACHTQQVHWRSNKLARDWSSLVAQVARWQATAGLRWSKDEINQVAHHLNNTIYRFPQTGMARRD